MKKYDYSCFEMTILCSNLTFMKIKWSSICPNLESIHLATVLMQGGRPRREHTHDFYECFLVDGGSGRHRVSGAGSTLKVRELIFIRPEHSHAVASDRGCELVFSNIALASRVIEPILGRKSFPSGVWEPGQSPAVNVLSRMQCRQFHALMTDLGNSARSELDAEFFLLGLLRILRDTVESSNEKNLPEWLRDALPEAAEQDNLRGGMPRLVELCGRSPEHVSRSFQKYLGATPTAWLMQERVRQARYLLETSQLSILDVADACGIESPSYFHRCFKAATGVTPRRYRTRATNVQEILEGA